MAGPELGWAKAALGDVTFEQRRGEPASPGRRGSALTMNMRRAGAWGAHSTGQGQGMKGRVWSPETWGGERSEGAPNTLAGWGWDGSTRVCETSGEKRRKGMTTGHGDGRGKGKTARTALGC